MKKAFREDRIDYYPFCGEIPPPSPKLGEIGAEVRRFLKLQGLTQIYHPDIKTARMVQEIIDQIWNLFPCEVVGKNHPPIHGFYLYDRRSCKGDFREADGMCNTSSSNGQDGFSVIGLDLSAVRDGKEYAVFVLLHEFAHAVSGNAGHTPHFEAKLEDLILNYNAIYGTNIQNDYASFNDEK